VVDCTGHGVPGAFMSLIGSRLLNEIVNQEKIYEPVEILERMNQGIIKALKQDKTDNDDGMDVCLVRIRNEELGIRNENTNNSPLPTSNSLLSTSTQKITFAGAKRPLFHYKSTNNELQIIKGSRKTVGGTKIKAKLLFEQHDIEVVKEDMIYLTSDGFVDQCDENRKSFGTSVFLKLIADNAKNTIDEQQIKIETAFANHKKNAKQRDDVTIIGVKF
jgi:serine phosphatase RsbU (regulator of sigma subunit)